MEEIGAVVTAGLIAHEIEAGSAANQHTAHHCANCATPLQGKFCHSCGQSGHIHHSLLHLVEEVLHGVWHFDAKGWRTLPALVARPGELTRSYIDGQRMRYLSPLALFLFMIFFMFFVFSITGAHSSVELSEAMAIKPHTRAQLVKELDETTIALNKVQDELKKTPDGEIDKIDLNEAIIEYRVAKTALAKFDEEHGSVVADKKNEHKTSHNIEISNDKVDTGYQYIDTAIRHALDNPELSLYKIKNTTYKYAFILLPISLPFLWLMFFWRKEVAMYDHAVFSLYSMSFMCLLFSLLSVIGYFNFSWQAWTLFIFIPPVHMFQQLRGTYKLSVGSALWRTGALLGVSNMVFILFLLFVVSIGLK